jgi:hypothetical protein
MLEKKKELDAQSGLQSTLEYSPLPLNGQSLEEEKHECYDIVLDVFAGTLVNVWSSYFHESNPLLLVDGVGHVSCDGVELEEQLRQYNKL